MPGDLLLFSREQQEVLGDLMRSLARSMGEGGVDVSWTPGGGLTISTTKQRERTPIAAPRSVRMEVKQVFNDYLRCRVLRGTTEIAVDVMVAKPYKLRHLMGNYPNVTALTSVSSNEVDVTVDGAAETWELPSEVTYTVGDEILADRIGYTGVTDAGGDPVIWIDSNNDGRHWILKED